MQEEGGYEMLDVKRVRENFDSVKAAVERRGKGDFGIDNVLKLDTRRRELLAEVEQLKNKQNTASREVPKLKRAGGYFGAVCRDEGTEFQDQDSGRRG